MDQILVGCTTQLRLQYSSQDRTLKDIIQGYKALLRLLMAVRVFLSRPRPPFCRWSLEPFFFFLAAVRAEQSGGTGVARRAARPDAPEPARHA